MVPHDADEPDPFPWADPALKARLRAGPLAVVRDYGLNLPDDLPPAVLADVVRIVSLLWVDGKIVPREQFHIDPADEGLLFGRGVWESTRTVGGVPWLWPLHVERLLRTAALLDIDLSRERIPDERRVADFVGQLAGTDVVVRVNATAGRPGKRGVVWMSAAVRPFPKPTIRLQTCPSAVRPEQAFLVWKTFQYASRLRIGHRAILAGFDSALMVDPQDFVLESAHANIFLRLPEGWVTPSAESGSFLPGTVRQHLLQSSPIPIREAKIPRRILGQVREAFVTNSNVGLVPIIQIDDHRYEIGEETRRLGEWLLPRSLDTRPG